METAKFGENWQHLIDIDLLGHKTLDDLSKANWAFVGAGINTMTPAAAETADATAYWDGKGFVSDDVTGKAVTFQVAGHRKVGDPAQDYVASKFMAKGDEVKTLARWTDPEGNEVAFVATLKAITPFGGAANAKQTFSFTLSMDGKPKITLANGATEAPKETDNISK